MVPIFRRDIAGDQSIEKNVSTFEYVYTALQRNAHILIYPEAHTQFIYKIRPLRKGIVRMAWGFLKRETHEAMYIVPVGANFIWPSRFRSDVFIHVGEPIRIDETEGNEKNWYTEKLKTISDGMKKVAFDVEDEDRHQTIQHIVQIKHNHNLKKASLFAKVFKKDQKHVENIRKVVSRVGSLDETEFRSLDKKVKDYLDQLRKYSIKDKVFSSSSSLTFLDYVLLVLGFPVFIAGAVLNGFGLIAGYFVKSKFVKRVEYKAAVSSAIPAVLTLISFIFFLVLGIAIHWHFIVLAFAFPVSMYCFIYYYDLLDAFIQKVKWSLLKSDKKEKILAIRRELINVLENLG